MLLQENFCFALDLQSQVANESCAHGILYFCCDMELLVLTFSFQVFAKKKNGMGGIGEG